MLPLCRAIANFPLPPDTERIFERMVGLSLVKTDLSTPLHVRIQDPLNNEKGPFNTTNFTKRNCKVVLSWVRSELAQDEQDPRLIWHLRPGRKSTPADHGHHGP